MDPHIRIPPCTQRQPRNAATVHAQHKFGSGGASGLNWRAFSANWGSRASAKKPAADAGQARRHRLRRRRLGEALRHDVMATSNFEEAPAAKESSTRRHQPSSAITPTHIMAMPWALHLAFTHDALQHSPKWKDFRAATLIRGPASHVGKPRHAVVADLVIDWSWNTASPLEFRGVKHTEPSLFHPSTR